MSATYVMVDVEADGPVPGDYSMIWFGAVIVEPALDRIFQGHLSPVSDRYLPEALAVSGVQRQECLGYDDPAAVMREFGNWLSENRRGRLVFVSDNNGFDWQFINWYFHHFTGDNPFGHSSMNLGSLYKGMQKSVYVGFRHLCRTEYTHNPVDDAIASAGALLAMKAEGLKIGL